LSQSSPAGVAPVPRENLRTSLQPLVDIARRLPWTASVLIVMAILGVVTGGLWRSLYYTAWWDRLAYGLPALQEGRWWTPVTGSLIGSVPQQYLILALFFGLASGFCEWRLGTRRAMVACIVGQLVAVLGSIGIAALLSESSSEWGRELGDGNYDGFWGGAMCAVVVVGAALKAPWRARVLITSVSLNTISLVWVGLFLDLNRAIATVVGLLMVVPQARTVFAHGRQMSRHEVRVIASALLVFIATAQVLAMVYPQSGPLGPEQTVVGRPLIILYVIAELLVAAGLHRGSRLAWSVAMALAITGLATSLALRPPSRGIAAAVVFLPLLILLIRTRKAYTASVSPASSARLRRDVIMIALGFLGYVVLGFALIDQFRPQPSVVMMGQEVVARAFFSSSGTFEASSRPANLFLTSLSLIPIVVFFLVLLLLLVRTRKPTATLNHDRALKLLHTHGGGNLSWMTTWEANAHFITEDGEAAIAYQVHNGTAVALSDPIGAPASREHAILEFNRYCEQHGMVPCVFSATGSILPQVEALGWRHVQVAEDTVIDLPALEFKGKAWQDVRTAINRAAKSEVSFRLVQLRDESFAMVQQARGISDQWVSDKGMPEMGFTLGGVDEALDPEVRVGLAVNAEGVLEGITSWLPVYGADGVVHGWTLDVMRRRPDGFRPVMEFMIASACLAFKEQGALTVSLSGAPLARSEEDDDVTTVEALLDGLGEMLEPVYGFRSLHQFKTKFKPRYIPMYMVYPDGSTLPRIALSLTAAFLPGAGLKQYASVLSSVRS